eukprot:RCo037861
MDTRNALTLSVLMNTKGLVELIVLNIGLSTGVITVQIFTIMVLMALVTTFMTTPLVTLLYRPELEASESSAADLEARRRKKRKRPGQLRLVLGISKMRNVPPLLAFLDLIAPTLGHGDLKVFCARLQEVSERPSTFMAFAERSARSRLVYDHPTMAVRTYCHSHGLLVRPKLLTSAARDMHEDLARLAVRKVCDAVVLPYHVGEGGVSAMLEGADVNQVAVQLLRVAPCTVVLVVDPPLAAEAEEVPAPGHPQSVVVLFFGGEDDREILVWASKLLQLPAVTVTLIHCRATSGDTPRQSDSPMENVGRSGSQLRPTALCTSSATLGVESEDATAVREFLDRFQGRVTLDLRFGDDPADMAIRACSCVEAGVILVGRNVLHPSPGFATQLGSSFKAASRKMAVGVAADALVGKLLGGRGGDSSSDRAAARPLLLVVQAAAVAQRWREE